MNKRLFSFLFISSLCIVSVMAADPGFTEEPETNIQGSYSETSTYNERTVKGFDPDSIICVDINGNGWTEQDECSWGDTSTPWFPNSAINTQKGTGVTPGGSGAALGQDVTHSMKDGAHFTINYYNAPSAPNTTASSGATSKPLEGAGLREQHNEFGFEVIVDKKTDPLEPYYMKFYIPYYAVDSTQDDVVGDMSGDAQGIYSKEVTEMDPNDPGVFNRYTVTGTFTSTGDTYSYGSDCKIGCTTDDEAEWRAQWP